MPSKNSNSNKNKSEFLDMPFGTAMHRLRTRIMFKLIQKCGEDICYRCGEKILTVEECSIEHKLAWEGISVDLFWDLDNISFSHKKCNYGSGRRQERTQFTHGTTTMYHDYNCRCNLCKAAWAEYKRDYNKRRKELNET